MSICERESDESVAFAELPIEVLKEIFARLGVRDLCLVERGWLDFFYRFSSFG